VDTTIKGTPRFNLIGDVIKKRMGKELDGLF
jgi:hypothetical protein